MELGFSVSHPHCQHLGLDAKDILKEVKGLGAEWVRLGCYWNEIETLQRSFDFSQLDFLLSICKNLNLKVVLTVGMKAPRWPEYYFPNWIHEEGQKWTSAHFSCDDSVLLGHVSFMLRRTVSHFVDNQAIKVWQIENEPLDPSGPDSWRIDLDFLNEEVCTLRKVDSNRPIALTAWGNELTKRGNYSKLGKLGDIVGVDLYPKIPNALPMLKNLRPYVGPTDSDDQLKKIAKELQKAGKQAWISELQMEPWETEEVTSLRNPPSCMPDQLRKNWEWAKTLGFDATFLWGAEYWLWRKANGDSRWWDEAEQLLA